MLDGDNAKMWMKVQLETAGKELVGYTEIPAFMIMPDVVIWGDRVFQLYDVSPGSQDPHVYRECFAVPIVEPVTEKP